MRTAAAAALRAWKLDGSRSRLWGVANLGAVLGWSKAVFGIGAATVVAATLVVAAGETAASPAVPLQGSASPGVVRLQPTTPKVASRGHATRVSTPAAHRATAPAVVVPRRTPGPVGATTPAPSEPVTVTQPVPAATQPPAAPPALQLPAVPPLSVPSVPLPALPALP